MKIQIQPIPVSKGFLDPRRLERALENFLDAGAENLRIDFQTTTQTWKHPVVFEIKKESYARWVFTRNRIYKFVSGGTRVRYATMTPGFTPKTRTGHIGSGPGSGGVLYVNRRRPRPGIRAREFPKAINAKWSKRWKSLFLRMQADALR